MDRLNVINDLNNFAIDGNISPIIEDLNNLLLDKNNNIDLIMLIINNCQLFGFTKYEKNILKYLNCNEKISFLLQSYSGNQFKYLNYGQLSLLEDLEKYIKILVSAPTSFGKTSIVNEYIIKNNKNFNNIIFVIPTNSLIEELYNKFLELNSTFKLNYHISTLPKVKKDNRNILMLTPERFLILNTTCDIDDFDLIIMDEMYKIINSRNSTLNDVVNERSAKFRKTLEIISKSRVKSIFLSPYTYNLSKSMQKFVEKYDVNVINRKIDYVNHNVYNIHGKKEFQDFFGLTDSDYYANCNVQQKVKRILENLSERQNIVYISSIATAEKIIDECSQDTNKLNKNKRYEKFYKHLCDNYSVDNLDVWKVIRGLEKGIGIYISPIPRYIKKEIARLFNDGVISTLIVTTSFVEGVNTNAENIIITSQFTAQSIKLDNIDLLNIMGRAGRFGKSPVGNIIAINKDIYKELIKSKNDDIILNNPNYELTDKKRNDYEIDMIDEKYLTENEKNRKQEIIEFQKSLGLTERDLNISLNVPKLWKLILYNFLLEQENSKIKEYFNSIVNIFDGKKNIVENSIESIFYTLRDAFDGKEEIFSTKDGDIRPFSRDRKFIWGILYKMHSYSNMKDVLFYKKKNIEKTVKKIFDEFINLKNKEDLKFCIEDSDCWVLNYLKSDLTIDDNKIYNETFKFMSDVMQYKIPFYVNFFVSVYKLFLMKNEISGLDYDLIKPEEIAIFFENGNIKATDQNMIDFGLPPDLLKLLDDNHIEFNDSTEINKLLFLDKYQQLILIEYQNIFYQKKT